MVVQPNATDGEDPAAVPVADDLPLDSDGTTPNITMDTSEGMGTTTCTRLIPHDEGVEAFKRRFPNADGRGVRVAVLDTGIDPSLDDFKVTPEGKPKLIEILDATGCCSVDISKTGKIVDGTVTGLTGRTLKFPDSWECPTKQCYLGMLSIDWTHSRNVARLSKEKREEDRATEFNNLLAEARKKLVEHEEAFGGSVEKAEERLNREELASQIDLLKSLKEEKDLGPVMDVVVFHDGVQHRCVLDLSYRGRLERCPPLATFSDKKEYGVDFIFGDQMVYSVFLNMDEKLVDLNVVTGTHGSHVAGILGAHDPKDSLRDGIAPGVEIVSVNISDLRIGGTETGTALSRAMHLCDVYNADLVNISFGEGFTFPNSGVVNQMVDELLCKGETLMFSSAGNQGPCTGSVGAPAGQNENIVSVGAVLPPEQSHLFHGCVRKNEDYELSPWSSAGPSTDGYEGVNVYACGVAIAAMPRSSQINQDCLHGTSMASPAACGTAALILSQLRQEGRNVSMFSIKLALMQSATRLPCLKNAGVVDPTKAYDLLDEWLTRGAPDYPLYGIKLKCTLNGVPTPQRGIYYRNEAQFTNMPHLWNVSVEPQFVRNEQLSQIKRGFSLIFRLQYVNEMYEPVESGCISFPSEAHMNSRKCSFQVKIESDANKEQIGFILGIDDYGRHVFKVPITIRPPMDSPSFNCELKAGDRPVSKMLAVPDSASVAVVIVRSTPVVSSETIVLHCAQLHDGTDFGHYDYSRNFVLDLREREFVFRVVPGRTMEAVFSLRNAASGSAKLQVSFEFMSMNFPDVLHLNSTAVANRFHIDVVETTPVALDPTISLKRTCSFLKPTECAIEPLGSRDYLFGKMQSNRLLLTYKLNVTKAGELWFAVEGLSRFLYDSPMQDFFIQVFSVHKQFMGASGPFRFRHPIKLGKGEYRVLVQIRHFDEEVLEKLKDATLSVYQKLPSPITLNLLKSLGAVFKDGEKFPAKVVAGGRRVNYYVEPIPEEKGLKPAPGCEIQGTMSLFGGDQQDAVLVPVIVHVNANEGKRMSVAPSEAVLTKPPETKVTPLDEMNKELREVMLKHLEKMEYGEEAEDLFNKSMSCDVQGKRPVLQTWSRVLHKGVKNKPELICDLMQKCDELEEMCVPQEVLRAKALLGTEVYAPYDKTDMQEREDTLVETAARLVDVLADLVLLQKPSKTVPPTLLKNAVVEQAQLEATVDQLKQKWNKDVIELLEEATVKLFTFVKLNETKNTKVLFAMVKYYCTRKYYAIALKLLLKALTENNTEKPLFNETLASELAALLEWDYLVGFFKNSALHRYKTSYRPF